MMYRICNVYLIVLRVRCVGLGHVENVPPYEFNCGYGVFYRRMSHCAIAGLDRSTEVFTDPARNY